jgi:alpha-mannosidase
LRRPAANLDVISRIQLDAGRPWIRIIVEGVNHLPDLRLRAMFGTGIAARRHLADAAYGRVWRSSIADQPLPDDVEHIPATAPLHRFVSVENHATGQGMSLLSDGLGEYEATPDGTIAVTLLRAVGELSRNDLPERPGHAGWPTPTPAAQCEGPFTASFALFPHGLLTDATIVAIEDAVEDFLVPPAGRTFPVGLAPVQVGAGLALQGAGLRFECCKESEDDGDLIVRCTNVLDRSVAGRWVIDGLESAWLCRLDERTLGALPVQGNAVAFEAPPHAVMTLRLRRAPGREG